MYTDIKIIKGVNFMIKNLFFGISLLIVNITYWVTTEPSHWSWYIVGIGLILLTAVFVINADLKEEKIHWEKF